MAKSSCSYLSKKELSPLLAILRKDIPGMNEVSLRNLISVFSFNHYPLIKNEDNFIPDAESLKKQLLISRIFNLNNNNLLSKIVDNTLENLKGSNTLNNYNKTLQRECLLFKNILEVLTTYNEQQVDKNNKINIRALTKYKNQSAIKSSDINDNMVLEIDDELLKNMYVIGNEDNTEFNICIGKNKIDNLLIENQNSSIENLTKLLFIFNRNIINRITSSTGYKKSKNELFEKMYLLIKNNPEDVILKRLSETSKFKYSDNILTDILETPDLFALYNTKNLKTDINEILNKAFNTIDNCLKSNHLKNIKSQSTEDLATKFGIISAPSVEERQIATRILGINKNNYEAVICELFNEVVEYCSPYFDGNKAEVINYYTPNKIWETVRSLIYKRGYLDNKESNNQNNKDLATTYTILKTFNTLVDDSSLILKNKYNIVIKSNKKSLVNLIEDSIDLLNADYNKVKANYDETSKATLNNFNTIAPLVKQVLANIKKTKSESTRIFADIYECYDPVKVHGLLMEHLSNMHTSEDLMPAIKRLSQCRTEFIPLYEKLLNDTQLQALFYTDFRRCAQRISIILDTNDVIYVNGLNSNTLFKNYKNNSKDITNLQNSDFTLYDENGKLKFDIVNANTKSELYNKLIKFKDTLTSYLSVLDNQERIYSQAFDNDNTIISDIINFGYNLGIFLDEENLKNLLHLYTNNNENGLYLLLQNYQSIVNQLLITKESSLSYNRNTLFDFNINKYSDIANLIALIDSNTVDNMATVKGKSLSSHRVPNFLNTIIEKLSDYSTLDDSISNTSEYTTYNKFFINNKYKKNYMFYDKNKQGIDSWRNPILKWIMGDNAKHLRSKMFKSHIIQNYKGKEFKDFSRKDIYDMTLLMYFNSIKDKSINNDKNRTAKYVTGPFADNQSLFFYETAVRSTEECMPFFIDYINQDLERMFITQNRINKDLKIQNFDDFENKFCVFPELNTLSISYTYNTTFLDSKENTESTFTGTLLEQFNYIDNLYKDFKVNNDPTIKVLKNAVIKKYLNRILNNQFNEFVESLIYNNSISKIKSNSKSEVSYKLIELDKVISEKELKEFYSNYLTNTIGMTQLESINMAFYKDLQGFFKRNKQTISPYFRYYTKTANSIIQQKSIILKSEKITSSSLPYIQHTLEKAVADKKLTEQEKNNILKSYVDFEVADGQAYRSLSSYIKLLEMKGDPDLENFKTAAEHIKEGHWNREEYYTVFQTIKQFMYTQRPLEIQYRNGDSIDSTELLVPTQFKNSEALLFMGMLIGNKDYKNTKLGALNDFMEQNNIDSVVYESGVKVGCTNTLDISNFDENDYKNTFEYLQNSIKGNNKALNTVLVDTNDLGIQTSTPESLLDSRIALSVQFKKIILSELDDKINITLGNKQYNREEIWDLYNKILIANSDYYMNQLEEILKNPQKLSELLIDQLNSSDIYDSDLKNYCTLKDDGSLDFNTPMYNPIQSGRIQSILLSILKKTILSQTVSGGDCIAVSAMGHLKELSLRFKDKNNKILKTYQEFKLEYPNLSEQELKKAFNDYVKNNDGSFAYMEVYYPCFSSELRDALLETDENGNEVINIDKVNSNNEKIFPDELRYIIGYRAPTEAKYSIVPMKVVKFLPPCHGSSIIIPPEVQVTSGSDNDGDKFFTINREMKSVSKQQDKTDINFNLIKYDHTKSIEENSIKARLNLLNEIYWKVLTEKNHSFSELQNGNFDTIKTEGITFDIINRLNLSIKINSNLLSTNEAYTEEDLEDINTLIKEIKRKYPIYNKIISTFNSLSNSSNLIISPEDLNNIEKLSNNDKLELIYAYLDQLKYLYKTIRTLDLIDIKSIHSIMNDNTEPNALYNIVEMFINNSDGKNLIGFAAIFNGFSILLNHTNATLRNAITINNKHYNKLYKDYINDKSTTKIIHEIATASVDNAKEPSLGFFNLNKTTANTAFMMSKLGIDSQIFGLLFNQPCIKELIAKINNGQSYKSAYKELLTHYSIKSETQNDYNNYVPINLDTNNLIGGYITGSIESQNYYLKQFNALKKMADDLSSVSSALRVDKNPPANFGEIIINIINTELLNKNINSSSFSVINKNEDGTTTPLITIKNDSMYLNDDNNYVFKNKDGSETLVPIPYLQDYYQKINLVFKDLIKDRFPFLNDTFINTLLNTLSNTVLTKGYLSTSDESMMINFINDFITFQMTKSKGFLKFLDKNNLEKRNEFILTFPNYFTSLYNAKENNIFKYKELRDCSFLKYLSVVPVYNNEKFKMLSFSGNILSKNDVQLFKNEWTSLLYSSDVKIQNFARQLFVYGFLTKGLKYNSTNITSITPEAVFDSISGYKESMENIAQLLTDENTLQNDLNNFIFQYCINNPENPIFKNSIKIKESLEQCLLNNGDLIEDFDRTFKSDISISESFFSEDVKNENKNKNYAEIFNYLNTIYEAPSNIYNILKSNNKKYLIYKDNNNKINIFSLDNLGTDSITYYNANLSPDEFYSTEGILDLLKTNKEDKKINTAVSKLEKLILDTTTNRINKTNVNIEYTKNKMPIYYGNLDTNENVLNNFIFKYYNKIQDYTKVNIPDIVNTKSSSSYISNLNSIVIINTYTLDKAESKEQYSKNLAKFYTIYNNELKENKEKVIFIPSLINHICKTYSDLKISMEDYPLFKSKELNPEIRSDDSTVVNEYIESEIMKGQDVINSSINKYKSDIKNTTELEKILKDLNYCI